MSYDKCIIQSQDTNNFFQIYFFLCNTCYVSNHRKKNHQLLLLQRVYRQNMYNNIEVYFIKLKI